MKKKLIIIALALAGISILAIAITLSLALSAEPIVACDPIGDARPLCGWQNPEDMEALPDGRYVLVSEFGDLNGTTPGMISLLDLETEARKELYKGGSSEIAGEWGEATCTQVASGVFNPHGIHLSTRSDGTLQLLVVQHGSRESVEMFTVTQTGDTWDVEWRGCAVAPDGSMLNDVVATPDDGFLVTHMMNKAEGDMAMFGEYIEANVLGSDTGYVISWNPTDGFGQLANSSGIMPNGIQISDDAETVFVNYSGGELRRISRLTGEIEASNDTLPPIDNVTWTPDGRLLLAGGTQNFVEMLTAMVTCSNLETGTCPVSHAILSVDPDTLAYEIIYEGGSGTPGGSGSVGLEVSDGSLLIGTPTGDRIVRVKSN